MLFCSGVGHLVIVFLLLAVSVVYVKGGVKNVYTTGGPYLFESARGVTKCILELPDGTKCEYIPNTTPLLSKKCFVPDPVKDTCNIQVEILNVRETGVYKLKATSSAGIERFDVFIIYLRYDAFPQKIVKVIEKENIYLRIGDPFLKAESCDVFYPNAVTEVLMLDSTVTSTNYWGANGECGVQIKDVAETHIGKWTLTLSSDAAHVYTEFEVTVTLLKDIEVQPLESKEWIFGESGTVSIFRKEMKFCEIRNPRNETVPVATDCTYTQDVVTESHEGIWTFFLGMNGKVTEDVFVQQVKVVKESFHVSVVQSERFPNGLDLLCSLSLTKVEDCRFIRPDGEVILPDEGIGNDGYSYFGNGFEKGDCGISIHELQEIDKGWWKCLVSDISQQRSEFLNVSATEDQSTSTDEDMVVVKDGEVLSLSCKAQVPLDYCWFHHPSGSHLRFSTEKIILDGSLESKPPRSYTYMDTLLEGVCAIEVSNSNSSADSGQWSCHLGVLGNLEEDYELPIEVMVSKQDVISLNNNLTLSSGSTVLKCSSVPLGRPMQYCRFIRPDGKGFNVVPGDSTTVLDRYQYEAEGLLDGECGLKITSTVEALEDVGVWTCVARLQGEKQEGQDFINVWRVEVNTETAVASEEGLSAGVIVGIAIGAIGILLLIAAVAFCLVRRHKVTQQEQRTRRH